MVRNWVKSGLSKLVYGERLALVPGALQSTWAQRIFLKRFLTGLGIDCVFDVGANGGQYGAELRRIGYRGHIISFEPDPTAFALLEARSASDPRWQAINKALGRTAGRADFHIMAVSLFNSFRSPSTADTARFRGANDVARTVEVEVARLSDLLPELRARHGFHNVFLKMDTQGFDTEVFAGAIDCHSQIAGIQSEIGVKRLYEDVSPWTEQIKAYQDAGFEVAGLYAVNPGEPLVEFDCYFRRASEI